MAARAAARRGLSAVAADRSAAGQVDTSHWRGLPVVVTGGAGFLGRPVVRMLEAAGASVRSIRSSDYDLRDSAAARAAVDGADVVIHLAARVGGIGFNSGNPAVVAQDNLEMAVNVFRASRELGVGKLVAACSVCAYPEHTEVPFREEAIWDGYPDPKNAAYGLAKKMMLVLSDSARRQYGFDSCVPVLANLYGPGDNYDLESAHVIAAMVRKYVDAATLGKREVVLWGTGRPSREFLYVDDAARAMLLAAERCETSEPVNIGVGRETRIDDLAERIRKLSGYEGETVWDDSRPDGQLRRGLEVSRAKRLIGFSAEVELDRGLQLAIDDYRDSPD